MIRARIFDNDETLLHFNGDYVRYYTEATRAAIQSLIDPIHPSAHLLQDEGRFAEHHVKAFYSGGCMHQFHADEFGLQARTLLGRYHDQLEADRFIFDTGSAAALNGECGTSVILTDGNNDWGHLSAGRIGHRIDILARDRFPNCLAERKAVSDQPFIDALHYLRVKTGYDDLMPEEVELFDDSGRVLKRAAALGFRPVQCVFGGTKPDGTFPVIQRVGPYIDINPVFQPAFRADPKVLATALTRRP